MKGTCKLIALLVCCGLLTKVDGKFNVLGCIKMCAFCVENFGKDLYNGAGCRDFCIATKGESIDYRCTNDMFHTIRKKNSDYQDYYDSLVTLMGRKGVIPSKWQEKFVPWSTIGNCVTNWVILMKKPYKAICTLLLKYQWNYCMAFSWNVSEVQEQAQEQWRYFLTIYYIFIRTSSKWFRDYELKWRHC